jgi:hypothetical protein
MAPLAPEWYAPATVKLREAANIVELFAVATGVGCGSSDAIKDGPCPAYLVTPDAGVAGFSSVGEWRSDSVCAMYCQKTYPVCELTTQTTVKCQQACF